MLSPAAERAVRIRQIASDFGISEATGSAPRMS